MAIYVDVLTTPPKGMKVVKNLGAVAGSAAIGRDFVVDEVIRIFSFVGGDNPSLRKATDDAVDSAMGNLIEEAEAGGANAILGLQHQLAGVDDMVIVSLVGSAVLLEKEKEEEEEED